MITVGVSTCLQPTAPIPSPTFAKPTAAVASTAISLTAATQPKAATAAAISTPPCTTEPAAPYSTIQVLDLHFTAPIWTINMICLQGMNIGMYVVCCIAEVRFLLRRRPEHRHARRCQPRFALRARHRRSLRAPHHHAPRHR